jgi:hypothetical protein
MCVSHVCMHGSKQSGCPVVTKLHPCYHRFAPLGSAWLVWMVLSACCACQLTLSDDIRPYWQLVRRACGSVRRSYRAACHVEVKKRNSKVLTMDHQHSFDECRHVGPAG